MKKFLTIIKNEFQRHLAYRANIATYSFGHVFEVTAQIIVWTIIYQKAEMIKGYTYPEMLTYVIVGWFILFATSSYGFEDRIAKDIHQGVLSNLIIKPINYVKYMIAVSVGRVVFAVFVVTCIEIFLIIILHDKIIINSDPFVLLFMAIMMILSFFTKVLFSIMIGLLAFWIVEISGTYFSLNILNKFLSGAYFPINLLPKTFTTISLAFPFVYTFFVPIQLYLGKMSLLQGLYGFGVQLLWLFLLYVIIKIIWHFGLRRYESAGI